MNEWFTDDVPVLAVAEFALPVALFAPEFDDIAIGDDGCVTLDDDDNGVVLKYLQQSQNCIVIAFILIICFLVGLQLASELTNSIRLFNSNAGTIR